MNVPKQSPLARVALSRVGRHVHMTFPSKVIDGNAVRDMFEHTATLTEEGNPRLIVDFTGITFVNSGAMGMLITMRKKLMHVGGEMRVVIDHDQVRHAFHTTRLDAMLDLRPTLDDARADWQ